MNKLFVHCSHLSPAEFTKIQTILGASLDKKPGFYTGKTAADKSLLAELSAKTRIDINVLPDSFDPQKIKLLISDMDSTLIAIECIDEIADFAGLKPQIAKITAAAMQGKIDFSESLRRRVSLLKNLDIKVLQQVYTERLRLNPGAENLLGGLKDKNIKFALVSGGFTFFTAKLAERLPIDFSRANVLDNNNGILTGKVIGKIIDANAKQDFLLEICREMKINPKQAIAIGDGANDLKMMNISGLSVAYHAKKIVQENTDVQINYSGLEIILDFLD